jgi:hypothetical protein
MRKAFALALLAVLASLPRGAVAQEKRPDALLGLDFRRQGHDAHRAGKNYPATWLYQRADLPVKVLEVYPSWRKVQDPDGTAGWMLVNLLSDTRTAIVRGTEPAPAPRSAASRRAHHFPRRARRRRTAFRMREQLVPPRCGRPRRLHQHRPYLGYQSGREVLADLSFAARLANGRA